jgi:hypothetical protein
MYREADTEHRKILENLAPSDNRITCRRKSDARDNNRDHRQGARKLSDSSWMV